MKILLETEQGVQMERIIDGKNDLIHLLWKTDISATCCLRFIDPYGNTVFNRQQMESLIAELHSVENTLASEDREALLHKIGELARRCSREVHTYLVFRGD